jgi:hypothetical protein
VVAVVVVAVTGRMVVAVPTLPRVVALGIIKALLFLLLPGKPFLVMSGLAVSAVIPVEKQPNIG